MTWLPKSRRVSTGTRCAISQSSMAWALSRHYRSFCPSFVTVTGCFSCAALLSPHTSRVFQVSPARFDSVQPPPAIQIRESAIFVWAYGGYPAPGRRPGVGAPAKAESDDGGNDLGSFLRRVLPAFIGLFLHWRYRDLVLSSNRRKYARPGLCDARCSIYKTENGNSNSTCD